LSEKIIYILKKSEGFFFPKTINEFDLQACSNDISSAFRNFNILPRVDKVDRDFLLDISNQYIGQAFNKLNNEEHEAKVLKNVFQAEVNQIKGQIPQSLNSAQMACNIRGMREELNEITKTSKELRNGRH